MAEETAGRASGFSSSGARLLFENVPWKEWESAAVEALHKQLDNSDIWTQADLLRFLHLAISFRNEGKSGTDATEEDVELAKELLLKSRTWKESNRPKWTVEVCDAWKHIVFVQGRDKRGQPLVVVRPSQLNRATWEGHSDDLAKCLLALLDGKVQQAYLPGVAEQSAWIIDLHALGVRDIAHVVPAMQGLFADLLNNFPSRAGPIFVVNAGWTLSAAVNTVLMFAQAESREKVQVFRGGFGSCAKEYFDLAALPVEFGGEGALGPYEAEQAKGA